MCACAPSDFCFLCLPLLPPRVYIAPALCPLLGLNELHRSTIKKPTRHELFVTTLTLPITTFWLLSSVPWLCLLVAIGLDFCYRYLLIVLFFGVRLQEYEPSLILRRQCVYTPCTYDQLLGSI